MTPKLGRNDPCHCGSGKKYKSCHLVADEAAARQARVKAAEQPAAAPAPDIPVAAAPAPPPASAPRHATQQPWKRGGAQTARGFQRFTSPRKVGGS